MSVELRNHLGQPVRRLPDPSGGTFDQPGDFDRFFNESYFRRPELDRAVLGSIDPDAVTEQQSELMNDLLIDVATALGHAQPGAETRGIMHLRVLAQLCAANPEWSLVWLGD